MLPKYWATFGAILKNDTFKVKSALIILRTFFRPNWATFIPTSGLTAWNQCHQILAFRT